MNRRYKSHKSEFTYYFDMDGVLAKWDTTATEEDTHKKGYFLNREADSTVLSVIKGMTNEGYNVKILSAAYQNGYAEPEKRQWLLNQGILNPVTFVPYGKKKSDYVPFDTQTVLIDDYTANLIDWKQSNDKAIGVKYLNGVNGGPGSWDGLCISHKHSPEFIKDFLDSIIYCQGGIE